MSEGLNDGAWTTLRVRVPPELAGYGPSLIRFFDAMIFKLRRNAHKGKWEKVPLHKALDALKRETSELENAMQGGNSSEILMEAADTANEALIIAEIGLEARHATAIEEE